jgi:hypothetical protein
MNKLIKYLQYNEKESNIYLPNEIFKDLSSELEGSSHIAFAYSYYYFISWLYRYSKYGQFNIDVKQIKEVLGYSPNSKEINYIIKKDGVLDQIGYTFSSTDYPIAWDFNDGEIEFTMFSDLDLDLRKILMHQKGRNYKVKVPVKAFWRDKISEEEGILDGTFYDIRNTHHISFDVFLECMSNKELGCTGFYLYGYLRYRCQWHDEYNSSFENIGMSCGVSKNTAEKYLNILWQNGLIQYNENPCRIIKGEYKKEPNTYWIA